MAVTKYILMNQDTPVLDFICRRNEFDEPEFYEGLATKVWDCKEWSLKI